MKLIEIINATKGQNIKPCFDLIEIAEAVGIYEYIYNPENCRITENHYKKWLCTDTRVGSIAYYLDDELVAISHQSARKSSPRFEFVSKDAFDKLLNYIRSLIETDLNDELRLIDLDEEVGDSYQVSYSTQILSDVVIYKGERCPKVQRISTKHEPTKEYFDYVNKTLDIIYHDQIITVNIEDVSIPYIK